MQKLSAMFEAAREMQQDMEASFEYQVREKNVYRWFEKEGQCLLQEDL